MKCTHTILSFLEIESRIKQYTQPCAVLPRVPIGEMDPVSFGNLYQTLGGMILRSAVSYKKDIVGSTGVKIKWSSVLRASGVVAKKPSLTKTTWLTKISSVTAVHGLEHGPTPMTTLGAKWERFQSGQKMSLLPAFLINKNLKRPIYLRTQVLDIPIWTTKCSSLFREKNWFNKIDKNEYQISWSITIHLPLSTPTMMK